MHVAAWCCEKLQQNKISMTELQVAVQTPFVELKNHIVEACPEFLSHRVFLSAKSVLNTCVSLGVPFVQNVNLIQGNDEGTFSLLQELQRLNLGRNYQ